jgi:hypothetical protein
LASRIREAVLRPLCRALARHEIVGSYPHIHSPSPTDLFLQEFYLVLIQIQAANRLLFSVAYGSESEKMGVFGEKMG